MFFGGLTLSQPDHVDKFEGLRFKLRPTTKINIVLKGLTS